MLKPKTPTFILEPKTERYCLPFLFLYNTARVCEPQGIPREPTSCHCEQWGGIARVGIAVSSGLLRQSLLRATSRCEGGRNDGGAKRRLVMRQGSYAPLFSTGVRTTPVSATANACICVCSSRAAKQCTALFKKYRTRPSQGRESYNVDLRLRRPIYVATRRNNPFRRVRATVAPPVMATGGLVAVRLCIEADYSRKANQAKPRPVWEIPCSSRLAVLRLQNRIARETAKPMGFLHYTSLRYVSVGMTRLPKQLNGSEKRAVQGA